MYGNSEYAKGCLLARRLIERGVRTVQLSLSIDGYDIAWDTGHGNIVDGHRKLATACDQGIAALIQDLKQRGLFDETLIIWGVNLVGLRPLRDKKDATMTITDSQPGWPAVASKGESAMEPLTNLA